VAMLLGRALIVFTFVYTYNQRITATNPAWFKRLIQHILKNTFIHGIPILFVIVGIGKNDLCARK
jgi:hypothetical protein